MLRYAAGLGCALALAGPALAQERFCTGEASGSAGKVTEVLVVENGRPKAGVSRWSPEAAQETSPGAGLILERPLADPAAGTLGPTAALVMMNSAPLDPPKAERAVVCVSTDLAKPICAAWGLYAKAVDGLKTAPAGSTAKSLVGSVPLLRQDAAAAPLMETLDRAKIASTSVTDEKGAVAISMGWFNLSDRVGARKLTEAAHRAAMTKASAAAERCQAAPPRP